MSLSEYLPKSNPTSLYECDESTEIALLFAQQLLSEDSFSFYDDKSKIDWILGPLLYPLTLKACRCDYINFVIDILVNWTLKQFPGETNELKNRYLTISLLAIENILDFIDQKDVERLYDSLTCIITKELQFMCNKSIILSIHVIAKVFYSSKVDTINPEMCLSGLRFIVFNHSVIDESIKYLEIIQQISIKCGSLAGTWASFANSIIAYMIPLFYHPSPSKSSLYIELEGGFGLIPSSVMIKVFRNVHLISKDSNNSTKTKLCVHLVTCLSLLSHQGKFCLKWPLDKIFKLFAHVVFVENPSDKHIKAFCSLFQYGAEMIDSDWMNTIKSYILHNLSMTNVFQTFLVIQNLYQVSYSSPAIIDSLCEKILSSSLSLDTNYLINMKTSSIYQLFIHIESLIYNKPGYPDISVKQVLSMASYHFCDLSSSMDDLAFGLLYSSISCDANLFFIFLSRFFTLKGDSCSFSSLLIASLPSFLPIFTSSLIQNPTIHSFITDFLSRNQQSMCSLLCILLLLNEIAESTSLFDKNMDLRTVVNMFCYGLLTNSDQPVIIKEFANSLIFSVSTLKKHNLSVGAIQEIMETHKGPCSYYQLFDRIVTILYNKDNTESRIIIRTQYGNVGYIISDYELPKDEVPPLKKTPPSGLTENDLILEDTCGFTKFSEFSRPEQTMKDLELLVQLGIVTPSNHNHLYPITSNIPEMIQSYDSKKLFCSAHIALARFTANSDTLFSNNLSSRSFEKFLTNISSEMLYQKVQGNRSKIPLPIGDNETFKYAFVSTILFENDVCDIINKWIQTLPICIVFNESKQLISPTIIPNSFSIVFSVEEVNSNLYRLSILRSNNLSFTNIIISPMLVTPVSLRLLINIYVLSYVVKNEPSLFVERSRRISEMVKPFMNEGTDPTPILRYLFKEKNK